MVPGGRRGCERGRYPDLVSGDPTTEQAGKAYLFFGGAARACR